MIKLHEYDDFTVITKNIDCPAEFVITKFDSIIIW